MIASMVIVGGALIAIAATGYGAVAEAIGAGLLVLGAAMSGVQIGAGINSMLDFYQKTRCDRAKTPEDLDGAGRSFGDGVAKMGVGGLNLLLALMGGRKAAKAPRTPPKRAPNLRSDLGERWFKPNDELDWPSNYGFIGEPKPETLPVGTRIDRYGSSGGSVFSPENTPYSARALPYDNSQMKYHVYEVVKPLEVESGPIQPHFDQSGLGTQYKTSRSVQQLVDDGYLREVPQ